MSKNTEIGLKLTYAHTEEAYNNLEALCRCRVHLPSLSVPALSTGRDASTGLEEVRDSLKLPPVQLLV